MRRLLFFAFISMPFFSFSQMASIELEVRPIPESTVRDALVEKWNNSQSDYNKLTPQSKDFLYWINFGRSNPEKFWDSVIVPALAVFPSLNGAEAKSLHEDLIKTGPLPMSTVNNTLLRTAQLHASDISKNHGTPSHTSTDGTNFGTRIRRAGIKYCANENIAISSQGSLLAVLLLYLDIGLPDLGHRKSLLNPILIETGIGTAPYDKDRYFIVQDLSCSQN